MCSLYIMEKIKWQMYSSIHQCFKLLKIISKKGFHKTTFHYAWKISNSKVTTSLVMRCKHHADTVLQIGKCQIWQPRKHVTWWYYWAILTQVSCSTIMYNIKFWSSTVLTIFFEHDLWSVKWLSFLIGFIRLQLDNKSSSKRFVLDCIFRSWALPRNLILQPLLGVHSSWHCFVQYNQCSHLHMSTLHAHVSHSNYAWPCLSLLETQVHFIRDAYLIQTVTPPGASKYIVKKLFLSCQNT